MPTENQPSVSIMVPCYNEAQVLPAFLDALDAQLKPLNDYRFELLFIDDGSQDDTLKVLQSVDEHTANISIIALARNYGHQRALTAGLDHVKGDFVIFMDADLQDPPELIPEMLRLWEAGCDIVHTVRTDRSQDSLSKRVSAHFFYALMRRWVLPELPVNAGDYKGLSRRAIEGLLQYNERVRFLRATIATLGFKQVEIPFTRPKRHAGKSKYPWISVMRLARDAIMSNTVIPLRLALFLGVAATGLGLVAGLYTVVLALSQASEHWMSYAILTAILLVGGLNLAFMGILGEYIKILILETKQRPQYLIREIIQPGDSD